MAFGDDKLDIKHDEAAAEVRDVPVRGSVARSSFNKANAFPTAKRSSFSRASFSRANDMMVFPDATHIEVTDQDADDSIENVRTGPFVWMVAAAASIAGREIQKCLAPTAFLILTST